MRLSKKDLETLSILTPSLSKRVQDQLLAQLPPTQAKKLSRTLSMLNNNTAQQPPDGSSSKAFRRSQSTARDSDAGWESRSTRASSVARDIISPPLDYKSYKFPYYSEIKGSSNNNKSYSSSSSNYESLPNRTSPSREFGRPPSGCFSPPPDLTRRRSSTRRISRFLRPDFYETPKETDSAFVREKKEREAETQRVLREIRERSRDRSQSRNRESESAKPEEKKEAKFVNDKEQLRHLLNTVDSNIENLENQIRRRRSMSRDIFDGEDNPIKLTDRILDDLHNITLLQKQVSRESSVAKQEIREKTPPAEVTKPKTKKVSKLVRPKSYPSKDPMLKVYKQKSSDGILEAAENIPEPPRQKTPPKPSSPPPKEVVVEPAVKKMVKKKIIKKDSSTTPSTTDSEKKTKKVVKKKIEKPVPEEPKEEVVVVLPVKEKSPEKKPTKGFLTTIQQKFERFRESTKANREAKKLIKENGSQELVANTEEPPEPQVECSSKIDAVIRTLRERSVARETGITESNLIKRAVSVEDMPDAGVNRVLGIFKKIEKGPKSVKSSSYIPSLSANEVVVPRERPKSAAFVIKNPEMKFTCPDCEKETVQKREKSTNSIEKERLKNNRKGLMLDLEKNGHSLTASNISYPPPPPPLLETPSYENIANFSAESQSSSTNIVSQGPDDLYDDWSSTCSDDHLMMSSATSLSPRISRFSQHVDEPNNENVLDRIRRRSFFPRFNEKKNRRVSSIVGPAARDYYATAPTAPSAVTTSTTPSTLRSTSKSRPTTEYNRSQTTSLDAYRSSAAKYDYTRSSPRYGGSSYETSSSGTSSLYSSFRRPSYVNGSGGSSAIDSYATIGRKTRPYEHRTVSLLEGGLSRRETEMGLERDDVLRLVFEYLMNGTINNLMSETLKIYKFKQRKFI